MSEQSPTGRSHLKSTSDTYARRLNTLDAQIKGLQDAIKKAETEKAEIAAAKSSIDDQIAKMPAPKAEKKPVAGRA
jgi:chromosome segregation ATPase